MSEFFRLGPIGRRVLGALLIVAMSSIAVLAIAAVVGVDLSRAAATRADREAVAAELATEAGAAFARSGEWSGDALDALAQSADAAGAHFIVIAPDGAVVFGGPVGLGFRERASSAPVIVGGQQVGAAYLAYREGAAPARPGLSTIWIAIAVLVAGAVAMLMAFLLTHRLTEPLASLMVTVRSLASGDLTARAKTAAPGELGELARTLNDMADEVLRAQEVARRASADVAHEIRTPLTLLQAGLEEIKQGHQVPDDETVARLHDQSVRLGRVVNDLQALSQAESAGPELRPQDLELADVARGGLDVWEGAARSAGQSLHVRLEDGVWVSANPDRMHQVVGNLLANAVRHGRPGDAITVEVRRDGPEAVIAVRDTGPGIPAEDVPHVFDRLWRGADRDRTSGSGLGLSVARALVEAQGGRIDMESIEGRGTVVTVRMQSVD